MLEYSLRFCLEEIMKMGKAREGRGSDALWDGEGGEEAQIYAPNYNMFSFRNKIRAFSFVKHD